jgi:sugar lactone lactonase YvrE
MRNKMLFVVVLACLLVLAAGAAAQDMPAPVITGDIILEGLTSPQGVYVDSDGALWVIDSGLGGEEQVPFFDPNTMEETTVPFGNSGRLLRWTAGSDPELIAELPSAVTGGDFVSAGRVIVVDGVPYLTVGAWIEAAGEEVTIPNFGNVVRVEDGALVPVADLWAFERANNPDETTNIETHPYGIAASPDGHLVVADAAGNDLLHVDPESSHVGVIAVFDPLPGVFPSPYRNNELLTDPVPTQVVANEDGSYYVSLLSGAPFIPGSASVMMVSADGEVTPFATGLTMLTDLRRGPDGNLYATSFGMFTQDGPVPNSGSVIRILEDGSAEVVVDGLPFVTGLALDADGGAYVLINGLGIPNAGAVVYYEGLTEMPGMPMPAMAAP